MKRLRAKEAARKRRIRRLFGLGTVGMLVIAGLIALGLYPLFQPAEHDRRPIRVHIPTGSSVAHIGQTLQANAVIRSGFAFDWYMRFKHGDEKFRSGTYVLSPNMTLDQIAARLKNGGSAFDDRIRVTIPEGYTLKQIAGALEEKGICNADEFERLATDPASISSVPAEFQLPKQTLEGYLFPDTYGFLPHTPPRQVLDEMLMNFYSKFARPYQSEISASGRSLHAVVTAASLVEREAKVPQDRARIAGVLDNRLKRGIKLEVDATVLYALGEHKERVTFHDLTVASPYNTYRHKGLPPGPIANPGLASLEAVLNPEKSSYLYYVARPTGAHIFTRTLPEHEAAKKQVRAEWRRIEVSPEARTGG